jgi:hypothetical protein
MVVICLNCNSYSVFHSWIGNNSRVTKGCSCENQVYISAREEIQAEDYDKVEVWNPAEQKFITYTRYQSLCASQKA